MRVALAILALAASALAAPADSSSSSSSSTSKTKTKATSAASSTSAAAPSPTVTPGFSGDGQTRVSFPAHGDWWVAGGAMNNLRWHWVSAAQTLVSFSLHNDGTTKTDGGANSTTVVQGVNPTTQAIGVTLSYLNQDPGDGYFLVMSDFYNPSQIYATSQTFALKPAGSPVKAGATALAAPAVLVGAGAVLAIAAGTAVF